MEFVKGHLSFPGTASPSGKWTAEDDRLAQLIEVFGPFSESLRRRGVRSGEFFDSEGMQLGLFFRSRWSRTGMTERIDGTHSCPRGSFRHTDLASGNLLRIPKLSPASLLSLMDGEHEVLRRPKDMPQCEVPIFVDFLEGMLAVEPDDRKSAAEMLEHPWLAM